MPRDARGLLVFDLDGVLVDVSQSYRRAIVSTVAALGGGEAAPEEIQALKNAGGYNNDWDLSRELLRRRGQRIERPRVIEVFNQFYLGKNGDGLILQEQWMLPPEALAALGQRYRLAIFTGRPRADADFVLQRFRVASAFKHLVALEDVPAQKPDPAGLEQLRARHAPSPIAAYVGDTVDDARCAAAAGVDFIGILDPRQHHGAELATLFRQAGCQFLAQNVAAAARHLLERAAVSAG